jgi:hypothetical protein
MPSGLSEPLFVFLITDLIGFSFIFPELSIGFGDYPAESAVVHMPVAAMNKDDFAKGRENKVRFSSQVFSVKSVSEAHGVDEPADKYLGFCIL